MARFPDRARVCFIGASTIQHNHFLAHIVAYYREHFKSAGVEFYNCGISGGTITTVLNAFDEDVMNYDPTHAVIMIGMNDSCRDALNGAPDTKYNALQTAFEAYRQNLEKLCGRLEGMGVSITLCTFTPYAEYIESNEPALRGGSALFLGYADYIRAFAKDKGYPLCDYHSYLTRVMQTEALHEADRVHANKHGHYYMAKCFMESQGFDIGEEKELPSDVQRWHEATAAVRQVIAAEHFIMHDDFTTAEEERIAAIKAYLDTDKEGRYVEYFKSLAREYQKLKPEYSQNIEFIKSFMKE